MVKKIIATTKPNMKTVIECPHCARKICIVTEDGKTSKDCYCNIEEKSYHCCQCKIGYTTDEVEIFMISSSDEEEEEKEQDDYYYEEKSVQHKDNIHIIEITIKMIRDKTRTSQNQV